MMETGPEWSLQGHVSCTSWSDEQHGHLPVQSVMNNWNVIYDLLVISSVYVQPAVN